MRWTRGLCGLLALALCGAARGAAPGTAGADAEGRGRAFVEMLAKGDFAGAEGKLDTVMKAGMPEDKLRTTWQTVVGQCGAFGKVERTRSGQQGGFEIVEVTCQFEKTELDARVVLDGQGLVTGLYFVPATPDASVFKTPAYAKAGAYEEKDFTVGSGEWALPGTLTMPLPKGNGRVPAVVLVHGSGPNDRDETVGANKVFRDLAWGLASRGIAVLRYDKRTRVYPQKLAAGIGDFTVKEETIDDAVAAAAGLRKVEGIDAARVYMLGHSLGATVMPRIGQADPDLAGLIMMAGTSRPLEDVMAEQYRYLAQLEGPPSKEEQAALDKSLADLARVKKLTAADAGSKEIIVIAPPTYWMDLSAHDEVAIAQGLKMPLLILQGGRDYQVKVADFEGWKKGLAGKAGVTLKLYPDLNHLFETGTGPGVPGEYEVAGNVDGEVVGDIADWIVHAGAAPGAH